MDTTPNFIPDSQINESLSQHELSNIYSKLAINENFDFQTTEQSKLIETYMSQCFNVNFLKIDTNILQNDHELISTKLTELLKFCKIKNFKNPGLIFITFVDYFDLDYNKTYVNLQQNLQAIIKASCQRLIGKDCYSKYYKKVIMEQGYVVTTLAELAAKRKESSQEHQSF